MKLWKVRVEVDPLRGGETLRVVAPSHKAAVRHVDQFLASCKRHYDRFTHDFFEFLIFEYGATVKWCKGVKRSACTEQEIAYVNRCVGPAILDD